MTTAAEDSRPPSSWQLRVATRGAERAQQRSLGRKAEVGQRLVDAAGALLEETCGFGFTVKQVSERAGVALLTLYRYFETKDDLILAVIEESILRAAEDMSRELEEISDHLDRLRLVVTLPLTTMAADSHPAGPAVVREHVRLTAQFASELEQAVEPYRSLIARVLAEAVGAGVVTSPDVERDATLIHRLIISFGVISQGSLSTTGSLSMPEGELTEYVWQFCLAGLNRQ